MNTTYTLSTTTYPQSRPREVLHMQIDLPAGPFHHGYLLVSSGIRDIALHAQRPTNEDSELRSAGACARSFFPDQCLEIWASAKALDLPQGLRL